MNNREKIAERRNKAMERGTDEDLYGPRHLRDEPLEENDFRLSDEEIGKRARKWRGALIREQQPPAENE